MAAMTALRAIGGLAVFDPAPVQASVPYAVVDAGLVTDWGHKNGEGREVRMAVTIRDRGERPERLRRLVATAEAALAGIAGEAGAWRVVTMRFVRSRLVREPRGDWAAVIEHRARMLKD